MSGQQIDGGLARLLAETVSAMPDPAAGHRAAEFEAALREFFGVPHAIAVASGTAALHTALVAAGVGPGDEVLLPALTVVMSAAPVLAAGATPVFVDSDPATLDLDYGDAETKLSPRTRAIMPVHLWGRMGDPQALRDFAIRHQLTVIEDAAQAAGSQRGELRAGCVGDVGCFSTKDGKILWSGEGGFILTADADLAAVARAYRTHWQTPPPGGAPGTRIGANYRLAEPLAAIAAHNARRLPELLARRRDQTEQLTDSLADVPGLTVYRPMPGESWNRYAPLARIELPNPRSFAAHLARLGVPNSTGTYGLIACDRRPMFAKVAPPTCVAAARTIDAMLAVVLTDNDDEQRIDTMAATIAKEAAGWMS